MTKVRFAPSPTGKIHIGNARTALLNWLYAKSRKGEFVLRFDDTDQDRSRQEYADAIVADLHWLGIHPDHTIRQSDRFQKYDEAADQLRRAGLLYACYETPDELDRQRKRRLARGLPPVYDRGALKLTKEDHQRHEAEGRKPHWRFLLPNFEEDPFDPQRTEAQWHDIIRGDQTADLASLSDPVLIRGDGTYLYTLPSCVDDMELVITHILRGDDHVTNTAVQLEVFKALGAENLPVFGHHNLLQDKSGAGLSKRLGSLSLESLRGQGYEPGAVASLATLIGTSLPVEPKGSLDELSAIFTPEAVTKSAAKFDPGDLKNLNVKLLQALSYGEVAHRLDQMGIAGGESFWEAVKGNLEFFEDCKTWWTILNEPISVQHPQEDLDYLKIARENLPDGAFDAATWSDWTSTLKEKTGRKGKALFMPLRRALTGLEHGPEIGPLLPFLGREETLSRLP